MNKLFSASLIALTLFFSAGLLIHGAEARGSAVHVNGYYRNGTYVAPHYRSAPDGNVWNNWSTVGNVNPYTGKVGTKNPLNSATYSTPGYQPSTTTSSSTNGLLSPVAVPTPSPLNQISHGTWYGTFLMCDNGYRQSGTNCEKVVASVNATVYGSMWFCNNGYHKVGETCVKVVAPANATVYGSMWFCNHGYIREGTQCKQVIAPANAIVYGSSWYCNFGVRRIDDQCVPF